LSETEDWFDANTVNRHMKHLGEAYKIFEKTSQEMSVLQQRLESAYEDIGSTLGKYYDINGMVNEAAATAGACQDYQKFFTKAMKKFKIQEPGDLESDKQKKKFFKVGFSQGFASDIISYHKLDNEKEKLFEQYYNETFKSDEKL
jgi:hypothetical protein